MANRKIQIDILANPQGFTKGVGQASQSATTLADRLNKLGPIGKAFGGVLNTLGLSSITTAQGIAGLGVAALAAAGAMAEKAISAYVTLGEKVRNYSILTGQSAEESSRQVQAFAELGVGEDVAASGMVKLSKAIETTPKKLEAFGIQIAKDAQGNVDLGQTLLNVAQAWQSTTDAAKRNEIALAAFGKGGAAMIPILQADSAELARLEKQVGMVYTAADLERVRQYNISEQELKRSTDQLGLSVGQALLPAQQAAVESANENIYVNEHLSQSLAYQEGVRNHNRIATAAAAQALREEYRAAQDARRGVDDLANAQQTAANAAQAEADAENKLYDSIHKSRDAEFAYEQSLIDLQNAYDALRGPGSATEVNLKLREAYVKVADAAVTMAEEQAAANGVTLSASEKADIYRATLEKLMAQLSPDDPLRKNLQAYIDELNSIPSSKTTTIGIVNQGRHGQGYGQLEFDEGGVVPGPVGEPVPALVHGGEVVLNQAQQKALAARGSAAPKVNEIHIHIDGLYADGPALDKLANALARRLTYVTGR